MQRRSLLKSIVSGLVLIPVVGLLGKAAASSVKVPLSWKGYLNRELARDSESRANAIFDGWYGGNHFIGFRDGEGRSHDFLHENREKVLQHFKTDRPELLRFAWAIYVGETIIPYLSKDRAKQARERVEELHLVARYFEQHGFKFKEEDRATSSSV